MSGGDTIFALASAHGQAGLGVIRISGPDALDCLTAMVSRETFTAKPRHAHFVKLQTPDGKPLDEGIALYFSGPNSYTGEDTVELMLHGSRAVQKRVFEVLSARNNVRMAEAGEFTKRAFMNGRLDLTEAEAVADLIHAETEAQRILALNQLGGSLHTLYGEWTQTLARALAHQEAEIEFPDEDMPDGLDATSAAAAKTLLEEISRHLDDNARGERLRDGLRIVIFGAPNAGKSSLLNWLAGRDAAIVTDIPGTTRDIVEVHLNLSGYPVIVTDTAGLRGDHADVVEAEGIRRATAAVQNADIKIALYDINSGLAEDTQALIDQDTCIVANKTDCTTQQAPSSHFAVSVQDSQGLDGLLEHLSLRVRDFFDHAENTTVLTRERHRTHLSSAYESLNRALNAPLPELAAEDMRQALLSLGRITGHVDVEALLDIVFRDFCIGK